MFHLIRTLFRKSFLNKRTETASGSLARVFFIRIIWLNTRS